MASSPADLISSTDSALCLIIKDLWIGGRGGPRVRDLTENFFAYSQNIDFPESFSLPYFTRKVNSVILREGGYEPSRSQNDKTSNIKFVFSPARHSR